MSNLDNYIEKRKRRDKDFMENFEAGYNNFKIGVMLRQAREQAGITQEEIGKFRD